MEKIYEAKPFHRFRENSIFDPQNLQDVSIFEKFDEPRPDPVLLLKSTGICSTSHLRISLEARRRQHMRQHGENEKNESQNSSE